MAKEFIVLILLISLIGIVQADEQLAINCAGDEKLGISCLSSEELGNFYGYIPSHIPPGGASGGPAPKITEEIDLKEKKPVDYLLWILIFLILIVFFWWFFILWKRRKKEEKEKKEIS